MLLTLAEAESVRAALHAAALARTPLAGRGHPAFAGLVALLPGAESAPIGASGGHAPAHPWFGAQAEATLRFFDNQPEYGRLQADALLRGLQQAEPKARAAFFEGVRACRRRRRVAWERGGGGALGVLLTVADEQTLLIRRAALQRMCRALRERGMLAADAFRAFDRAARGTLGPAEVAAGAAALGVRLTPAQGADLFRALDADGDDLVTLPEFRAVFTPAAIGLDARSAPVPGDPDAEGGDPAGRSKLALDIAALQAAEDEEEAAARQHVEAKDLKGFRAKPKPTVTERVWSSLGSGSRDAAGVWAPQLERSLLRRNRARVCVSHYPACGFEPPDRAPLPAGLRKRPGPLTLEVIDDGGGGITGSAKLPAVARAAMPYPARFQLAWSVTSAKQPLYVWRALSPSPATHTPLGMVATATDQPPPLTALRCVPRRWLKPAVVPPAQVWENAGSGGRRGALWVVNALGCLEATTGGALPTACCFDLVDKIQILMEDLYQPHAPGAPPQQPGPVGSPRPGGAA